MAGLINHNFKRFINFCIGVAIILTLFKLLDLIVQFVDSWGR